MRVGRLKVGAAVVAAQLIGATAVCAEDWIPSAKSTEGTWETDLASLSRRGDVVQSWMRETRAKPIKDNATGKMVSIILTQRYDDCEARRLSTPTAIARDREGNNVNSATLDGSWKPIVPGSVGEAIWHLVCTATSPPKEKPFLDNISSGNWLSNGASGNNKFYLYTAMDRVVRLDADNVLVFSRSDYAVPEFIDGFPIRYILTAQLFNCTTGKVASFGADFYASPTLRLESFRTDANSLKFESLAPNSFGFNNMQRICSAAVPLSSAEAQSGAGQPAQSAVFSGTAWLVVKGYLVTAYHVVEGSKRVSVYSEGQKVGEAQLVSSDPANDLAVLRMTQSPSRKPIALPITMHSATLGKTVFTLGYPVPDDLGQKIKMTSGQVSSTAGLQDDARFIQISVPIQQGNSGGPIIGWDGAVFGVVEAKLTHFTGSKSGPAPENVNYAVKASYVMPLLDDLPDLGNYVVINPKLQADDLVQEARRAVFMLVATQ